MTSEAQFVSPRRTKLRPPRLANDLILRPRLLARLDRLAALSLIVAPAGYGKTTLISMWLAQSALPSAWISLDDKDDDPSYFLADVVTAIRTLFPEFGGGILELLGVARVRPFADLVTMFINELNLLNREFVLVLDDYDSIHDPAIHQWLVQLLTHPPGAIHLVIAARHDPPLPWHIRTRGYSCEIRARDLSFTAAETAEFLAKATAQPIEAETARTLAQKSEGWITSLRLAALEARRQPEASAWPALLDGNRRNFVDYFAAEVIAYLPDSTCDFLVRTSIVDTLNGALCDFVLGDPQAEGRGGALLQQLEADGVFTVALDDDETWFRLHPLFRHALQHKLQESCSAAEIARLHERVVTWHEERGLLEEALHYALVDRQVDNAAAVVRRHRQQLLDTMDFRRLDRWLRKFPPSAIAVHPDLLLSAAWLMQIRFETLAMRGYLEQVEILLESSSADEQIVQQWRGEVAALRSQLYVYAGDAENAALAGKRALEFTPRASFYVRSIALLYVTFALYMTGESPYAESLLDAAAADPWIARDLAILRVQQVRHFVQLIAADIHAMRAGFPKLLQMATSRNLKTSIAWSHYFWGCACYLQNHLNDAEEHFRAVIELADYAHAGAYTHGTIGLALTRQAQGAAKEATAIVASAQTYLGEMQLDQMLGVMNAFAADLAVRQGRVEDAMQWLAVYGCDLLIDATPMFYVPGLAPVKVLMAAGTDEDLAAAQSWLSRVARIAVQTHNIHSKIQALALQAALSEANGNRQQALAALDRALALAEAGGIVRVFADHSLQLAPLLEQIQPGAATEGFIIEVRSAVTTDLAIGMGAEQAIGPEVPGRNGSPARGASGQGADPAQAVTSLPKDRDLRQILTYREMDVLQLLDQRLTNKEIARHLGISTETVRQHTVKLYRKLAVENRRQAIVAAHAMGYLDDPQ